MQAYKEIAAAKNFASFHCPKQINFHSFQQALETTKTYSVRHCRFPGQANLQRPYRPLETQERFGQNLWSEIDSDFLDFHFNAFWGK